MSFGNRRAGARPQRSHGQQSVLLGLFATLLIGSGIARAGEVTRPVSVPYWNPASPEEVARRSAQWVEPAQFHATWLDTANLNGLLAQAPRESARTNAAAWPIIALPLPDGRLARFAFCKTPVMAAELAARYPDVRTYLGRGVDEPAASVRFDLTPTGLHAQIRGPDGTVYVDPYFRDDAGLHVSYHRRDLGFADERFACHLGESDEGVDALGFLDDDPGALRAGGELRTYRLALAATSEYSQFHGGTKPLALAAMVTTINRVNGIYEAELGIRLQLIANTDLLIYLGEPDPYSNANASAMLAQNQANVDAVIGTANYDIGHVFATGGGGLANLGCVCGATTKAGGVTGMGNPTGDAFSVDYVAHEMGHQFAAQHTFNGVNGACGNAGQRIAASAYEPGSGSTIMCYAGICAADNLQAHSDAYFHHESIRQIANFIQFGQGASCAAVSTTGNADPTVDAGPSYIIPKQTPFTLSASAGDGDGDPVYFCWEQRDLGLAAALADPPNGSSPLFRSWTPTLTATRTLPRMTELLANSAPLGEALPLYNRVMNFRVTARDNRPGGGGVSADDMQVQVDATTGPFRVTAPNSGAEVWTDSGQVTWDVAGTTAGAVAASAVDIRLSLDGGLTFPYILATGTPNDGAETVFYTVPPTTTARVMVAAADNIFFDVSDHDFIINSEALVINLPDGPPERLVPGVPTPFLVEILELAENLVAGSARLHYRFDGGEYTDIPLSPLGGNLHQAVLPRAVCGDAPQFYITATGDGGTTIALPSTAPAEVYSVAVGVIATALADDFETDLGWTVSVSGGFVDGAWQRGVPVNEGYGDPPADHDGSGQCYVTENTATYPASDVDFGTTTLTSPVMDLAGGGSISFAYWLNDDPTGLLGAEDYLKVECARDAAGANWQTLRTYNTAQAAWRTDTILVGSEIPASATFRIRFVAADVPPGDVVEAGVDAFEAVSVSCYPVGSGDFDEDGDIDLRDFAALQACWPQSPLPSPCDAGDLDGNGQLDAVDLDLFTTILTGP